MLRFTLISPVSRVGGPCFPHNLLEKGKACRSEEICYANDYVLVRCMQPHILENLYYIYTCIICLISLILNFHIHINVKLITISKFYYTCRYDSTLVTCRYIMSICQSYTPLSLAIRTFKRGPKRQNKFGLLDLTSRWNICTINDPPSCSHLRNYDWYTCTMKWSYDG